MGHILHCTLLLRCTNFTLHALNRVEPTTGFALALPSIHDLWRTLCNARCAALFHETEIMNRQERNLESRRIQLEMLDEMLGIRKHAKSVWLRSKIIFAKEKKSKVQRSDAEQK
jgi:hypothetical protein